MSSLFAPSIKEIIPIDKIPSFLSFAEKTIEDLLEEIFYEDLVVYKSYYGEHGYYALTVVLYTKLGINFPGGFAFVLNPDIESSLRTLIPITFEYKWEALRYIKKLDLDSFNPTPQGFFDLLKKIVTPALEDLLTIALEVFVPGIDKLQTFIADFNNVHSQSISTTAVNTSDTATQIIYIVRELTNNGFDLFDVIFNNYINIGSPQDIENNIKLVFSKWLGTFDLDDFLEIIIPQFEISISNIDIGLEFPPNIFRQINPDGSPKKIPGTNLDVKSVLVFNVGQLFFSTKRGFTFYQENTFDFPRSEIAKTGLTLSISKAAVDLSNTGNNLPGTDTYPDDFKGIYVEEIIIGLPDFWSKDSAQTSGGIDIFGRNLLIGGYDDNGNPKTIFNGTVGLEGLSGGALFKTDLPGGLTLSLNTFSITFLENQVDSSLVVGQLEIPLDNGTTHNVLLTGAFTNNGFSLRGSGSAGAPLFSFPLGSFGDLSVNSITIGSHEGKFFFGFGAKLTYESGFPILDKLLPNPIELREFQVSENGIEKFDINLKWNDLDEVVMDTVLGENSFTIPVNLSIFDIIKIYTLKIGIGQPSGNSIGIQTLVDGQLEIGPLLATVGDIGLESVVSYAAAGNGNLGPLDIAFKFVPPTKIGLTIDAKAVKGGGAIWFDYDRERYVGALELSIKETLELAVVGIMSFKKPDGTKGFSLLLLVTVEFAPVQLGMGFVLAGVGGLLGVNRGMNADVLRDGIRTGLLNYILFPDDPVKNINSIVTGMESAFPQKQDQFIIGPMIKLGWGGVKSLVKLEIGLLIELFKPVKIAIPGILSVILPTDESDVIAINVNFIGIIDFEEKFASFDASLFDSGILNKITLSGDMAFRLKWGNEPNFLISLGGFHPEYTPPPLKLPKMARIGISLLNLKNAKVGFEVYFAVTTNSVQTGAAVFAEFTFGKFAVVGSFSFDALFEFNPFRMILSAELRAALEFNGFPIVAIVAQVRLSGPTPWNISGSASIAIIGIEFKADFDHTFGDSIDTSIPSIALEPLVRVELEKAENWRSTFPTGSKNMVQIKAVDDSTKVVAHPSGRFSVEQNIVPLNIQMDKYGQNGIADATQYSITKVSAISTGTSPEELTTSPLYKLFAPDQHFDLTEEEKLTGASFERFASGVIIDKTDKLFISTAQIKEVAYEQLLVQPSLQDANNTQELASTIVDNQTTFEHLSERGAVGESSLSQRNKALRQDIVWQGSTEYYIVNTVNNQPFVSSAHLPQVRALYLEEARHILAQITEAQPQLEDLLIVVEAYELDHVLIVNPADEIAVLAL